MGAIEFTNKRSAKTAAEAWQSLREAAAHEYGHGGYTGTIAEKDSFEMVLLKEGETPAACIARHMEMEHHWLQDKSGPAACIDAGPHPRKPDQRIFYFFGFAAY